MAVAAGVGAASSESLSGRVTTITASKIIATIIATSTFPDAPCFGASLGFDVFAGAGLLRAADLGVELTSTRPAPTEDGTGGITIEEADAERFLAADFLTAFFAVFLTALFFTTDFLATVFLTVRFFATVFFTADFLATVFLAAVFLTAGFFLAAVFLTAGFFLTATVTPCVG